jgi:hypothetical protein
MSYLDNAILFSPYKITSEASALRLHEQAMDIAQNADSLREERNIESAEELYRLAFVIESAVTHWILGKKIGSDALHRILIQSVYALAQSSNDAETTARCLSDFPMSQEN